MTSPKIHKNPVPSKLENIIQSCHFLQKRCERYISKVRENEMEPSVMINTKFVELCEQKIAAIQADKRNYNLLDQSSLCEQEDMLRDIIMKLSQIESSIAPEDRINLSDLLYARYSDV